MFSTVIAQDNFRKWNDALQTKDAKLIASLYSDKPGALSFLPTMSPEHVQGLNKTAVYFEHFMKKNPFGTVTDESVQIFDNGNAYLHSGLYVFKLRLPTYLPTTGYPDKRDSVSARFSMMWKSYNGTWKITHHHSSVNPGTHSQKLADELYSNFMHSEYTRALTFENFC
jgi:hypothetical protein